RRDVPRILAAMAGWEFFAAQDGRLHPLKHGAPEPGVHSLWGRPLGEESWVLELLLDEVEGDTWVFRRERSIRVPLNTATRTADGLPYLAPEIQLLYKAKGVRSKDDADFRCVAPQLDSRARTWLRDALTRLDERHEWITALQTPLVR